jgi:streptomycin 6-kinase
VLTNPRTDTSLARRIAECERRWNLRVGDPFPRSQAFVAVATTSAGNEVIVKITIPDREAATEVLALGFYGGRGAVRLLDADVGGGYLLLERVCPGARLSCVADDGEATRIAAGVMRNLYAPMPQQHEFPAAAAWAAGLERLRQRFSGATGPLPESLVTTAESLFSELLASSDPPVLVHGDLHHENILSAGSGRWIAIDPKGLAAEPAYEVGALLRNPSSELCFNTAVQRRRLDILSDELGMDRTRLLEWGVAQAVLSGWWSYEEGDLDWQAQIACAEALRALLP